jgi:hypothetical protein
MMALLSDDTTVEPEQPERRSDVYRIAQETLVASRMQQLQGEAEAGRQVTRINRPQPRIEGRVRHTLSLRLQLAR